MFKIKRLKNKIKENTAQQKKTQLYRESPEILICKQMPYIPILWVTIYKNAKIDVPRLRRPNVPNSVNM